MRLQFSKKKDGEENIAGKYQNIQNCQDRKELGAEWPRKVA